MRDFFLPGAEARGHDDNEAMAKCLGQRSTYDISVLQAGEGRVFVRFTPFVSRCGLDEVILDGGAVYAIGGAGRILDVR